MIKSNHTVHASPRFQVLSPDQADEMHLGTLEILRRTGVKVLWPEAREMLENWKRVPTTSFPHPQR